MDNDTTNDTTQNKNGGATSKVFTETPDELLRQAKELLKKRPELALVAAFLGGFLLALILRRRG